MISVKKISIEGEFWDSFIYSNNLILFDRNCCIKSYIWNNFVMSNIVDENDTLAYRCAFLQSDFLYGIRERDLFDDKEVKSLLENKFNRIKDIFIEERDLEKYKSFDKPIELKNLIIDLDVFKNTLYYCDSRGIYCRNIRKNNKKNTVSQKEDKFWDAYAQCLKISNYGRLALSASSDGLYEIVIRDAYQNIFSKFKYVEPNIYQITKNHSSYCCWSFSSLLNCSYVDAPQLFGFKWQSNEENHFDEHKEICFVKEIGFSDIFHNDLDSIQKQIVVSGNEKIYRIDRDSIYGKNYFQNNLGSDNSVFGDEFEKAVSLDEIVIDAEVATFGVIIETLNYLYVILSDGERKYVVNKKDEEIIRWRIFPRSTCYVNQLHVIYNDRIEILSFNEDYFVDQSQKRYGHKFMANKYS